MWLSRYILVDWLVEVTTMKDFSSLTLHVTVGCVDRYLALRSVPKARLQLLGIACMVVCTRWEFTHAYFLKSSYVFLFKVNVVFSSRDGILWMVLKGKLTIHICLLFEVWGQCLLLFFSAISVKKSWPYVKLSGSQTTPTNMKTWFEWWERLSLCWRERSGWVQQISFFCNVEYLSADEWFSFVGI